MWLGQKLRAPDGNEGQLGQSMTPFEGLWTAEAAVSMEQSWEASELLPIVVTMLSNNP